MDLLNRRDAIFDIFGIEIKNDRSLGFYIASSDMDGDSTGEWMLHTLCLNNVLQENADMKNRILVENGMRVYSLDRFVDMEELDQAFEIPEEFDAEGFFSNYFGVIVGDKKAADIVIRVEDSQAKYSYHLAPTYDFMQELLSHGAFVEVLSPESLRKEIEDTAAAMTKIYEKK